MGSEVGMPFDAQTGPASSERRPEPWRGTRRPDSGEGMGSDVKHLEVARRNLKTAKTVARRGPSEDKTSRAWREKNTGYAEMLGECHNAGQKAWPLESEGDGVPERSDF
ncbi:hypothetical protein CORC01_00544 [Colletotrichum orchidophilum]|uniref:Uncharacterized protein n=1 Tax=Colletotrichum orchidophilum TaxID=1209926 RepID=A0A1G4BS99_9PEZI|nr:uncharacterized protein CORC01_00544 [Colletotrichum orchidophilum]OHF04205.1 hypothetical protein CORC01_00544 [Colletotrichum orchidophilum]